MKNLCKIHEVGNRRGAPPPTPQGALPLDPFSGYCLTSSAENVPVQRRETLVAHGHGGVFAASRMLCIRRKRKETPEEKACFLSWRFRLSKNPWDASKGRCPSTEIRSRRHVRRRGAEVFRFLYQFTIAKIGFPSLFTGLESHFCSKCDGSNGRLL